MEKRIAVIGIIVENPESVEKLNFLLHEFSECIVGRMGLPYRERNLSIVSLAVDAPQNVISEMTGKIGKLDGISVKTAYSNKIFNDYISKCKDKSRSRRCGETPRWLS